MNIALIQIGKTDASYVREAVEVYFKRVNFYVKFDIITIPDIKNAGKSARDVQKTKEGEQILSHINESDVVVLLDETGREYTSSDFAAWMQKKMNSGARRLCFVIGGPYGFSREVYARSNEMLSMSKMTFSHQIIRVIFAEQLYRAFTIIRGEPYHHE